MSDMFDNDTQIALNNHVSIDELRRIPPRRIARCEVIAYAIFPLLLVMAGVMPSSAIVMFPFVLPLSYLLYRRFGPYFPLSCISCYGLFSLVFNYDILTVIYFCAMFIGVCGLIFSAQLKPYLLCATAAAVFAILGALGGMGIVRLAEKKSLGEVAENYVVQEYSDPVIGLAARYFYDHADLSDDVAKLAHGDADYDDAAAQYLAAWANEEFSLYAVYYCVHYGGVFGAVGYLMSVVINRRTNSMYDMQVCAEELKKSTRALGGAGVERTAIADMRIPRAFLWTCLLPTLVTNVILAIVGGFGPIASTLMHLLVVLPTAFCFFTLMAYFASLFKGKARVAAYAVLFILAVALVVSPLVLFVGSIIGVCDVVLNIRFWTEFIASD